MAETRTQCAAVRKSDNRRCGLAVNHPGWPSSGHSYDNPADPFHSSNPRPA
jgi:hypothetical protein